MSNTTFDEFLKSKKYGYVFIASFIIGFIFIGVAIFGLQEIVYWQKNGISAQGEVLDKYTKKNCQTSGGYYTCINEFYYSYRYRFNSGEIFIGEDSVNKEFWGKHEIGEKITLLYSAVQPGKSSISYAVGIGTQKLLWAMTAGVGVILVLISALLFVQLRKEWSSL